MDDAKLKVQALRDATNQVAATRSRIQNSSKRKEMAKAKITAATLSRLEGGAEMLDAITREIDSDLAHMITPAHLEAGGLPPIDVQVDEPKSKKSSE
jgi:expansin (peptidoglycan-binding protein)